MHPGWHILIPIITIHEIRYIFTEVLHGIPGVIVYDAPQETFQTLGTYQELVLLFLCVMVNFIICHFKSYRHETLCFIP